MTGVVGKINPLTRVWLTIAPLVSFAINAKTGTVKRMGLQLKVDFDTVVNAVTTLFDRKAASEGIYQSEMPF